MTATTPGDPVHPGTCGWTDVGGKSHPVVVLLVQDDGDLLVAHGTSQPHTDFGAVVTVQPDESAFANAFDGLSKATHFYEHASAIVARVDTVTAHYCPRGLWRKLTILHGL